MREEILQPNHELWLRSMWMRLRLELPCCVALSSLCCLPDGCCIHEELLLNMLVGNMGHKME